MKSLATLLIAIALTTSTAFSKEKIDCKNVKKFSLQAALCKTKAAGSSLKNKLSKKKESKNKSGEKSIFKKIGEAKTLSDIK